MSQPVGANVLPFGVRGPAFERRRHARAATPNISPQSEARLRILNMSPRGMAITSHHPFSIGGHYLFELSEEGSSLLIEGQIRWCDRFDEPLTFRTGIRFVGVQKRAPTAAAEHLSKLPAASVAQPVEDVQLTADRIARLKSSNCPNEAGEIFLDLLTADFEHLVLFRIVKGEIRAWMGRGPCLVPERLRRLRLDLNRPSIFLHLREGGSFFYGTLPAMFVHLQLLRCWRGSLKRECVLFPIRIKDRLVAVLYADAGNRPLSPEHLSGLNAATGLFTRSLVDQILRRKSQASVDSS